eukprot:scaffold55403_cov44-Attheya_sp.AAC.2
MKIFVPDNGEYGRITFAILSELGISNMDSFLDPHYWNTDDEMSTTDLDDYQKHFSDSTTLVPPTTPISVTDPDQFISPHPGENYINEIEPVAPEPHSGEKLPCENTWLTLGETGENAHKLPCENTWLNLGETGENIHVQGRTYILLFIFHMICHKNSPEDMVTLQVLFMSGEKHWYPIDVILMANPMVMVEYVLRNHLVSQCHFEWIAPFCNDKDFNKFVKRSFSV